MSDFIYGSELQEHHCRLGWEFFVFKKSDTDAKGDRRHGLRILARWESGMGGEKWIDDLVTSGRAEFLKAGGLFHAYTLTASTLVDVLSDGVPQHTGPMVIGDDYVTPSGWRDNVKIDWDALRALDANELLLVDMVDQS
jgi:hypothetical protein